MDPQQTSLTVHKSVIFNPVITIQGTVEVLGMYSSENDASDFLKQQNKTTYRYSKKFFADKIGKL